MNHVLKCWPEPFGAVARGVKRYEVRRFDRPFAVGDILELCEWDPETERYTGGHIAARVTYLTEPGAFGMPDDVGVLSIRVIRQSRIECTCGGGAVWCDVHGDCTGCDRVAQLWRDDCPIHGERR